jgi:hypothetical protein
MPQTRADVLIMTLLAALCLIATGITLLEPRNVLEAGLIYQGF